MKKIILVISALLLLSMQVVAQKYFDVYQNGKLSISIPTASVDSMGLTGTTMSDRKVNFYRNDNTVNSFLVSTVDSIKIFRTGDEQLVYLGIVGFNQDLYVKYLDVLAQSTAGLYTSYVSNLERKDGTLLYYAVDRALNILSSTDFPTPLSSVNLVTFTDGLDQGSLMMNGNYYTDEQYLNAVNNRIHNTTVKGLPVTAYSLGMRGSDVSDYTQFQNNLKKLASSADNAFEVSSMSDVSTRLQEISDRIISISNRQTFSFKIPGQSNGTLIRFTFDGYSPENSKMYIEGTFNLANRSLTNVTYHGIKATSGSYIQGTQNGIFVTFTFTGMQREDGNGLIPQSYIREYYKSVGSSSWQQNSEFSPSNNTQTTVTHSGAVIMLVLDCSNSLGSQFSNMKSYAQNFINRVANNTQEFKVETPQNVTATLDDNFMVTLNWDAVKHAQYYEVQRSNSQYGTFSTVANYLYSTSWTDKSPLSGNNYYKVIAKGHGLESTQNTIVSVERKLEVPKNVTATLTDNLDVAINWDAVSGAEFYTVGRCGSSNGYYSAVASDITSTAWTDKSPLSGNNYYKVVATGHGLVSAQSSYVFVERKLDAPKNVTATLDDNFEVTLNWDAVKGAEYYAIWRCSSSNGSYDPVAYGVTSTSWTDMSPLSVNNYYKVIAMGHGLVSAQSSYVYVERKLGAPKNVAATLGDNFEVTLNWDAVKGAESYKILRNNDSTYGTYSRVANGVTSTSWTDMSPLSGSNYYKVIACGHGLESAQSSSVSVKRKLDAPKNVTATLDDNFEVTLNWDAVKGAEYYEVRRSQSQNGTYSTVANNVTSASWTDEFPKNGYNYYTVIAYGHGLESSLSSSTAIKITLPLCPDSHHPHLIDLGLPSGTKWSCCNVGALKPEDYGDYYAWGETQVKSSYTFVGSNYLDGKGTFYDIGNDIVGTQYDAATVNWGSPWVMPSKDQLNELEDKCISEWTTENGANGRRFTGPNGASIFLPAAGIRIEDDLENASSHGYYWSSSLYEPNTIPNFSSRAWDLYFFIGDVFTTDAERFCGHSVRPVCKN